MGAINQDMQPVFPDKNIICKNCKNRLSGIIGYKNSRCDAYPDIPGKPNGILFDGALCEFYEEDKS